MVLVNQLRGKCFFDDVQEIIGVELLDRAGTLSSACIYRHGADRHAWSIDDRRAHLIGFDAAGEKVPSTVVGAIFSRQAQLGHLFIKVGSLGGSAEWQFHSCTSTRCRSPSAPKVG